MDDEDDRQLYPLAEILRQIVEDGSEDVRDALQQFRQNDQIPDYSVTVTQTE